jgi:predicted nucleic acid-binding protein
VKLVVDASVAIKWFLWDVQSEPDIELAKVLLSELLSGQHTLFQPPHWKVEILAVLARQRPARCADAAQQLDALQFFGRTPEAHSANNAVYIRGCELSDRFKQHLFDTLYHALALNNDAIFVTADERYYRAAFSEGAIQRLADFKTS